MKNIIYLILLFMAITQLSNSQPDISKEKEAVKQADIDFSDLSKEKGMKEAFLAYVANDGVLLRPYSYPIVGFDNIKKVLDEDVINFTLTWEPLHADVSASLDLGYTYGIYELTAKDENGNPVIRKGTYASIWKKQPDGKWKFVLDTGNPGLEPKK